MKDKRVIKILLLGTGESGKSTIFKQMQLLYTEGFNDRARHNFRNVIRKNVVEGMQQILKACSFLKIKIPQEITDAADYIVSLDSFKIDKDLERLCSAIQQLWTSESIKSAFGERNKFYVAEAAAYYFDRIDIISKPNYLPDNDDILRARLRTTGIVENTFTIENVPFTFIDVGGQRNERRKWIHCFDEVTTILFVAALSEFDQVLYEDEGTNRMKESIDVFAQIANSETFKNTPIILFLNKIDLFQNKLSQGITPKICFPDFKEGMGPDDAAEFVKMKFLARIDNKTKETFTHFTTAIDTRNIEHVWNSCRGIILSGVLREAGLSF